MSFVSETFIMSQDCFLNSKDGKNFGSSRGLSGLVWLSECNNEVKHNLISCHLSREVLRENELILARTDLFHLAQEDKQKCGFVIALNDKNRTIFTLKYFQGFLILVLGKRMKILYYFKPFDTKIIIRQVDYFLFLLAISSKYNFFHLFLIAVVNLVRKQLLRFYGD